MGVIGAGIVGSAVAKSFTEHCGVRVWDKLAERTTHSLTEVLSCDIVHVCVPEDQLESLFRELRGYETNFLLRSTVHVGTTMRLRRAHALPNLVHSPEFLTERCAYMDASLPARCIVGGPDCAGALVAARLYRHRFPHTRLIVCTADESEAIKLAVNAFFAVKVAYFNELRLLCDVLGLHWSRVLDGVLTDPRISSSHTMVPGPDGLYGFGGRCLPKDAEMLALLLETWGLNAEVTRAALRRNVEDRARSREHEAAHH